MAHHSNGASELRKASLRRREDADALRSGNRFRGAMYLAGYAVECSLKSKLMQMFGCRTLQTLEERLRQMGRLAAGGSLYTHQLAFLLRLTGRLDVLRQNAIAWRQFLLVNAWLPAWRYDPAQGNAGEADKFLSAVDDIISWIENNI